LLRSSCPFARMYTNGQGPLLSAEENSVATQVAEIVAGKLVALIQAATAAHALAERLSQTVTDTISKCQSGPQNSCREGSHAVRINSSTSINSGTSGCRTPRRFLSPHSTLLDPNVIPQRSHLSANHAAANNADGVGVPQRREAKCGSSSTSRSDQDDVSLMSSPHWVRISPHSAISDKTIRRVSSVSLKTLQENLADDVLDQMQFPVSKYAER